jgi:nucleoside-diphosphate-sugar epimerase
MKTILVTGANGFIGKHLIPELVKEFKVIALIHSKKNKFKHKNLKIIKCSITNKKELEKIFEKNKINLIIHLAGKAVNRENIDAIKTLEVNVKGTQLITEIGFKNKVKGIIFASTGKIYGKTNKKIINEKTKLNPQGIYPLSKSIAEIMLQNYCKEKNKACICLRFANVFGAEDENTERIVPSAIQKIIQGKNPVIHGTGKTKRNFVYITDVVGAIIKGIKLIEKKNLIESINISGGFFSLNEIVNLLIEFSGKKIKPKYIKGNPLSENKFSVKKAEKILKWKAKTSIKQGLNKTFEFYFKSN